MANVPPLARAVLILMGFNIFKVNVSRRTKGKLTTPQLLLELK